MGIKIKAILIQVFLSTLSFQASALVCPPAAIFNPIFDGKEINVPMIGRMRLDTLTRGTVSADSFHGAGLIGGKLSCRYFISPASPLVAGITFTAIGGTFTKLAGFSGDSFNQQCISNNNAGRCQFSRVGIS